MRFAEHCTTMSLTKGSHSSRSYCRAQFWRRHAGLGGLNFRGPIVVPIPRLEGKMGDGMCVEMKHWDLGVRHEAGTVGSLT